jgi:D-alanyl-D-alanine carboxypeptidase/D-alanyl-D-alanine-endopeptidase (penicillin-binding protein 4)
MKKLWYVLVFGYFISLKPSVVDDIEAIIKSVDPRAHVGVCAYGLNTKKTLYERQSDNLFIPASNTKIVTTLAALYYLGADFHFVTQLLTDGIIEKGTLKGNLYLKGDGDPSFKSTHLQQMVQAMVTQGIRSITGDLFIDTSVFDADPWGPGCLWDDGDVAWNKRVDGICIDDNQVKIGLDGASRLVCVQQPSWHAAKILQSLLKAVEINFQGAIKYQSACPQAMLLAQHRSAPLKELICPLMKISDNLYADCIFKKMGGMVKGYPGSFAKGALATKEFLISQIGLPLNEFVIVDGSGRSRYNLLCPRFITQALEWAYNSNLKDVFLSSLPVSAVDGTLATRMQDMPNMIFAKTGTLSGISACSGYLKDAQGKPYVFSIQINNFVTPYKYSILIDIKGFTDKFVDYKGALEDAICRTLIKSI